MDNKNKITSEFGNEESVFSMIPSFKVICDRDEFAIWLPSREESFIFLAEFFRLMPREIIFWYRINWLFIIGNRWMFYKKMREFFSRIFACSLFFIQA